MRAHTCSPALTYTQFIQYETLGEGTHSKKRPESLHQSSLGASVWGKPFVFSLAWMSEWDSTTEWQLSLFSSAGCRTSQFLKNTLFFLTNEDTFNKSLSLAWYLRTKFCFWKLNRCSADWFLYNSPCVWDWIHLDLLAVSSLYWDSFWFVSWVHYRQGSVCFTSITETKTYKHWSLALSHSCETSTESQQGQALLHFIKWLNTAWFWRNTLKPIFPQACHRSTKFKINTCS